jgi:hypothetical protein
MFPSIDSSLLFLLVGKDNPWLPWILLAVLLVQKLPKILTWTEQHMCAWVGRANTWTKPEYVLEGTIYCEKRTGMSYGNLSDEIQAFFYFLQNSKVCHTLHKGISLRVGCGIASEDKNSITIPLSGHGIWVVPNQIYARFTITKSDYRRSEDSPVSSVIMEECLLRITFQGSQQFTELHAFIQNCIRDYKTYKNSLRQTHLFVVKPVLSPTSECNGTQYIKFRSTKTFDNLFFRGKAELLARLEQFKMRGAESVAERLGLPSTLGLLFYGEPGTGKTSAIKAIANYMQMHMIIVPMSKIRTRADLERIFYDTNLCNLPTDKRIYVFEEIDCNGWETIVVDRKFQKPETWSRPESVEGWDALEDPVSRQARASALRKKEKENEDKLTLGALLEILDGLVECPGRIVIMTTNHRNVLDPALIRPGRIDMEIEFGRLSREDVAAIYERMWEMQVPTETLAKIPDGKYTQAEVAQMLYASAQDPNKFLTALIE